MSDSDFEGFGNTAKTLSRSPLGIIALFIVLIYGFAALTLGISAKNLSANLQVPLVWFLVLFPVVVLAVFAYLVTRHHQKLYGPMDFSDQALFLELQQELREIKSEVEPVIERQIEHEPSNDMTLRLHVTDDIEEQLLKTLARGNYTFRTTRGLAKEIKLPTEKVQTHLESLFFRKLIGRKLLKNGLWNLAQVKF